MTVDTSVVAAIIVIIVVIAAACFYQAKVPVYSAVDQNHYYVLSKYPNRQAAADLIARVNRDFMRFLRHLKMKYKIDLTDEERGAPLVRNDRYRIIESVLKNYNPEAIYENDPINMKGDTSYTVQKGDAIYLCVRNKKDPMRLVDYNTLMFVMLHEVGGHIGNYNGWGHDLRFWSVFKFMLKEAVAYGIYTPEYYDKEPVDYCGLVINYQPLFDTAVPNIED